MGVRSASDCVTAGDQVQRGGAGEHGPPDRRVVGVQTQLDELVRAGEQDARHQRVVSVAPAGGAMQRHGDPPRVSAAREIARGDERLLDGVAHAHHRLAADDVAAALGTGGAVTSAGADAFGRFCASALMAKSAWPWIAHWPR